MTMHGTTWFVLFGRRLQSSKRLTLSGYSGVLSRMSERHPDIEPTDLGERSALVGAWVDGRYYMGEPDGDEGEYLSAESTVPIEHAR